jgi:hypothetical protein
LDGLRHACVGVTGGSGRRRARERHARPFNGLGVGRLLRVLPRRLVGAVYYGYCPPPNQPPDCSKVTASPTTLWPPNHTLRLVTLTGATDPDGNPVTLTITGVTQDEPVNGTGDEDTAPDAEVGPAPNSVLLRAERSGTGDGRVYRIAFTASDGQGGTCSGTLTVGVPHDQGGRATPVDSAPPSSNSFGT